MIFNLPYRFRIEYKDYNINPIGVREIISDNKISNSIIFFTNDKIFASYSPQNSLNFDGEIIYALSQNEDYDYKLITKYPDKEVYYSYDGNTLTAKPNFYQRDIYTLKQDLTQSFKNRSVYIVVPWLNEAGSELDKSLPGRKININEFINLTVHNKLEKDSLIILLNRSKNLKLLLTRFYDTLTIKRSNFASPIQYEIMESKKEKVSLENLPLMKIRCYQGIDWTGSEIKSELVTSVNIVDCFGENKSIEWLANFDLDQPKRITFYLESDDGSQILIDDSALLAANGIGKQINTIELMPGTHSLKIKFFNGPNGEFLKIGTRDKDGKEQELSLDSSDIKFYLPKELWN